MTHRQRPNVPEEQARFRRIERPGHPDGDLYLWIDRWHSEPAPAWWWGMNDDRDGADTRLSEAADHEGTARQEAEAGSCEARPTRATGTSSRTRCARILAALA